MWDRILCLIGIRVRWVLKSPGPDPATVWFSCAAYDRKVFDKLESACASLFEDGWEVVTCPPGSVLLPDQEGGED